MRSNILFRIMLALGLLLLAQPILSQPATAATAKQPKTEKAEKAGENVCTESLPAEMLPADLISTTRSELKSAGFRLKYEATAGTLPVLLNDKGPECRIFYIGYTALPGKGHDSRPLTFVFNGGPGASSAYLHLGVLGPKRVEFNDDGTIPAPPPKLVDNPQTWLRFTDLVFVDPVGTGYSRCGVADKDAKASQKSEAKAWGVKEDLNTLSKFIRLYLTRNNRWLSPRYLVGESYGGFRVAALSDLLQVNFDISLNGVVLVSPALEFELLSGNEFNLLPWVAELPSYAAVAREHDKAAGPAIGDRGIRKSLAEVEDFAVREYLPALAMADIASLSSRLGAYIGFPARRVKQLNGRISSGRFAKELLQDQGLVFSRYDGSVTAIDPDPASPNPPHTDAMLARINARLAAAFNSYIREKLKFSTDIPYKILNGTVAKDWNWRSGMDGTQGFTGVAGNLKNGMTDNKDLRVLVAHGAYDLVTPYFGTVIAIRQMELSPAVAGNLTLKVYKGGHMFYTHTEARKRFFEDAERFYTAAGSPKPTAGDR